MRQLLLTKKSAQQGKSCVHDKIVVDASVALKWFLLDNEDHSDESHCFADGLPVNPAASIL